MNQSYSRRHFLMLTLSATALAVPAFAEQKRRAKAAGAGADVDLPWVKPGEGMAASVNFQASWKDVKDAKLKTERQGVPFGEKQTCAKCMLYTKAGMKEGHEAGKCTLFANQLVHGEGWCASWSKKA